MTKDEVVVVVGGLVAELIVIGTLVPAAMRAALTLTNIDVELSKEQVELMLQEQVVVPLVNVTSLGTVTIIFDPEVNALTVVNDTLRVDTTPIEGSDMDAELVVIVDVTADTVTLPVFIE